MSAGPYPPLTIDAPLASAALNPGPPSGLVPSTEAGGSGEAGVGPSLTPGPTSPGPSTGTAIATPPSPIPPDEALRLRVVDAAAIIDGALSEAADPADVRGFAYPFGVRTAWPSPTGTSVASHLAAASVHLDAVRDALDRVIEQRQLQPRLDVDVAP